MRFFVPGDDTPWLEVTNISLQGIWLLVDNEEFFLPYEDYPQFRGSTIDKIFNVERKGSEQISWPDLGLVVTLDAMRDEMQQPLPTS